MFQGIGETYTIDYEMQDDQVIAGFVSQGFGVVIVPNMYILHRLDVEIVAISNPNPERFFYLASMKNTYVAPAVKAFVKFVVENAQL